MALDCLYGLKEMRSLGRGLRADFCQCLICFAHLGLERPSLMFPLCQPN